jgi:hypothetical protein
MTRSSAESPQELLDAAVELLGKSGRSGTFRVQGDSMVPTLRPGRRFAVEFEPERLWPGMLLLYRQVDYLVVHRLLGDSRRRDGRSGYRTRGDGRIALDPTLDAERIVGRVVAVEGDGAWWSLDGAGARLYARLMAWHALFWAAVGAVARLCDRVPRRLGFGTPLVALAAWIDRVLLRLVHGLGFRLCHARVPPPLSDDAGPGEMRTGEASH